VESVILHENGHVVGLGHSEVETAVMYAYYLGTHRVLEPDDVDGITFLYPESTGTISGKVTEWDGGAAISGATVAVEGTSLSATTDTLGDYTIDEVPANTYDVTASASGFSSATVSDVEVWADIDSGVNFALESSPTGTIFGKVTESDGVTAISGATVTVEGTSLSATTNSYGDYTIGQVPKGTYDVTASASGFVSETNFDIIVTAGGDTTGVDFALESSPTGNTVSVASISYATEGGKNKDKHLLITIALVGDSGQAVAGASVSIKLYRDEGYVASGTGTTGTGGTVTFTLKNAASGCYTTTVTDVTAGGLTWYPNDPANTSLEFCK